MLSTNLVLPALTLWQREMVRFFRQRNRVTGSVLQPIVFWLLFGCGLKGTFRPTGAGLEGLGALEYMFPGTIAMIVLFTAIFSNFSLIEDRREGFLQAVLVSPVPRLGIVLGKVLGGASVAFLQAMIFLVLAPLAGVPIGVFHVLCAAVVIALLSLALTALGYTLAWGMDSTSGFHAVMMLFLMPMWLLSGSFFPLDGVPWGMRWIMRINPLTYGVDALRGSLYLGSERASGMALFGIGFSLLLTAGFAAAMIALAVRATNRRTEGSLA